MGFDMNTLYKTLISVVSKISIVIYYIEALKALLLEEKQFMKKVRF
jgi:hypothetical protein